MKSRELSKESLDLLPVERLQDPGPAQCNTIRDNLNKSATHYSRCHDNSTALKWSWKTHCASVLCSLQSGHLGRAPNYSTIIYSLI